MKTLKLFRQGCYDNVASYYDDILPDYKRNRTILYPTFGNLTMYVGPFEAKLFVKRVLAGEDLDIQKKLFSSLNKRVNQIRKWRIGDFELVKRFIG